MNFFEVTENGINTILKLKDNYDMILKEDGTIKLGFDDMAKFPKTFWSQLTYSFWKK